MSVTATHQKLVEVMNTLKGSGQPFSEVFAYPEASPKVFPFAVVDAYKGVQTDEASRSKLLRMSFIVRCFFQQQSTEAATAQRIAVLDQVLDKFTSLGVADYLDDVVIGMDVTGIEFFAVDTADQPVFGFDLIVECRTVMDVQ